MGVCSSRPAGNYAWENDPRMFIQKMKLLQQEITVILKQREEETDFYERELMVSAFREAEWKKERKKLREEVKGLHMSLEEREDRIRRMEEEAGGKSKESEEVPNDSHSISTAAAANLLLEEQMREERARRDEAVEKWKMLYLAIKHELDDLIQRTHQGTLYWRGEEEDLMEDLQRELKVKDETIEALKEHIASMEDEEYKRKREVDILRQSLRIMSNSSTKGVTSSAQVKSPSKPSIRFTKSVSKHVFVN